MSDACHVLTVAIPAVYIEALTDRRGSSMFARAGQRLRRGRRRERLPGRTVRRLRDYVESRLAEDLDVADLAAVAGLSAAHFARAFEATVGVTPFRYLMSRRLVRARDLLERTSRTALDICLDVGFKSQSHFTARFREQFGVTPRAFRSSSRATASG